MKVPFVDLRAQYQAIGHEAMEAMTQVASDADFILGDAVHRLEDEFAVYCGVSHAVGVDSGLSALELILRSYGIGPGDEVITVANTFIATASAVSFTGARPVLVDCDPVTYNIDPEAIARAVTPRTKAILPVHLYGQPAAMDEIMGIADRHGLKVIEDACQAHGSFYRGQRAGALGHAAAFSFYPAKNLGAFGDGGIVVTSDAALADRIRVLRNYGQRRKYEHVALAYNRRLDTIQAAVLRIKLQHLDQWNAQRQDHAARYQARLQGTPLVLPAVMSDVAHVYHLYVVLAPQRDELQACLGQQGISTGLHYPIPIHLQEAYADLGHASGDFPVSEDLAGRLLSLPMYPELSNEQIDYVAEHVQRFYGSPSK